MVLWLFQYACVAWGPYAREASLWEPCCRHSGVINMSCTVSQKLTLGSGGNVQVRPADCLLLRHCFGDRPGALDTEELTAATAAAAALAAAGGRTVGGGGTAAIDRAVKAELLARIGGNGSGGGE